MSSRSPRRGSAAETEGAKSSLALARAMVAAALGVCDAAGALWWQPAGRDLAAAGVAGGGQVPGETPTLRFRASLLRGRRDAGPVVHLSRERSEEAAFLDLVGARQAVLIPAREGRRWLGTLSVHDGNFTQQRTDLLVALIKQAAGVLRSLEVAGEAHRIGEEQSRFMGELGVAVASALSLDELLTTCCQLARRATGADVCLFFLAENGGGLRLRAQAGAASLDAQVASEALQLAELTRTDLRGETVWGDGGPGPAWVALQEARFGSALGLALSIRGEALGAILAFSRQAQAFSPGARRMMQAFASQAAVAIENLQLFESMQRRLLEMADLTWLSTRISATRDIARIAAAVAEAAAKALDVPLVALFEAGPEGRCELIPGGQHGLAAEGKTSLPVAGHLGAELLQTGLPQLVADSDREGRAEDALVAWLGARALLCVPMSAQQGFRGLLVVGDHEPRAFGSHDIGLLSNYANQAALAFQAAALAQVQARHLEGLTRLYDVSQVLASSLDLTETLDTVLNSASELLDAPVCSVMLLDRQAGELVIKAARGFWPGDALYERIKPGEGLAGRAAQTGMALTSSDISRDGRFKFRERAREEGLRTAIAAPLAARGRTLGVINLYRKSDREFTEADRRLLTSLANSAAVAIENANLYREAQERADFLGAMMSEINHRIRNTLQAIAGLLRMELDRPQKSAEAAIKRGMARIQSVAVVHELLRARELQFVDMKQVAERVAQLTRQSITDECSAEVKVTGARVMLPSQKATNVALVLAELIDNALRHALAGREDGRLSISLQEAGGQVMLQVKDNGPGLPEGYEQEAKAGLGLKIVQGLVEELGGTLELETRGGTIVRARFPKV